MLAVSLLLLLLACGRDVRGSGTPLNRAGFVARSASTGAHFVWRRKADLPEARADLTAVSYGGKVYLMGGCNQSSLLQPPDNFLYYCPRAVETLWEYDPVTDAYTSKADMPLARFRFGAAAKNGFIWVAGGLTTPVFDSRGILLDVPVNRTFRYEIAKNQWTTYPDSTLANMADLVVFHAGDGNVYATGGYDVSRNLTSQATTYRLDEASGRFVALPSTSWLNQNRGDAYAATAANGKTFVVGGWTSDDTWTTPLSTVEVFDPQTLRFSVLPDPIRAPGGDKVTCSLGSRVFAIGGEIHDPNLGYASAGQDEVEVLSVDYQSAEYNDWHYAGELPSKRYRFACSSVADTFIVVFGGQLDMIGTPFTNTSFYPVSKRVDELVEVRFPERVVQMHASGTANLGRLFSQTSGTLESRSRQIVRVSHRQIPSIQAAREFVNQAGGFFPQDDVYFADRPLPSELYAALASSGRRVVQVPLVGTAIRVAVDLPLGAGETLVLDACSLARLLSSPVSTTWAQAASFLSARNPWLSSGDARFQNLPVRAYRQVNDSSMTVNLVAYVQAACPTSFSSAEFWAKPVLASRSPPVGVRGSIAYAYPTHFAPGAIFREASFVNGRGDVVTSAQARAQFAIAAVSPPGPQESKTQDMSRFQNAFLNKNALDAWPLVSMTFAFVRYDLTGLAQTGRLVEAALAFILSPEGQALAASVGHDPLPSAWLTFAKNQLTAVQFAGDSKPYRVDSYPETENDLCTTRKSRVDYDVANLSALVTIQASQIAQLSNTPPPSTSSSQADLAYNVAVAALVIACFTFVLAAYAALKVSRMISDSPTSGINTSQRSAAATTKRRPDEIEVV